MGGYIANFTVYTMAMLGLICFALFVYKKFLSGNSFKNKSNFLGVEECISLAPRKNLYVVRAGSEKFLIASDVDKTTLISKLGTSQRTERRAEDIDDLPVIVDCPVKEKPVIKEMLKKINDM